MFTLRVDLVCILIVLFGASPILLAQQKVGIHVKPPGVIIDKSPDPKRIFIGSPSIAILPNGAYVASHDFFGPGTTFDTCAVFRSEDRGKTWDKTAVLKGMFWPLLFVCKGKLYAISSTGRWSSLVVRRSDDGGRTWTESPGMRTAA